MEMAAFANDTYQISSGDQGLYVRHRSKLTLSQVLGFAAQCFNSSFTWGNQDWRFVNFGHRANYEVLVYAWQMLQ